jgi:ribosomal protein L11 methyltransferase
VETPGAAVVKLDAGLAFGTGTHASTALCLEWLAGHDLRGKRVLDYGCGSGILAIAALKLGAGSAICVDIDPQALTATRSNAEANGVASRVTCASVEQFVDETVDIVLANILAQPLVGLAALLSRCTKPDGSIVLAGLLDRQADEVRLAYALWFDFADDVSLDGWTRLSGTRRHV